MEGAVFPPNPLKTPPTFPIKTADVAGDNASSLRAKSLQGVVVCFEDVTVDSVDTADEGAASCRQMSFQDANVYWFTIVGFPNW